MSRQVVVGQRRRWKRTERVVAKATGKSRVSNRKRRTAKTKHEPQNQARAGVIFSGKKRNGEGKENGTGKAKRKRWDGRKRQGNTI